MPPRTEPSGWALRYLLDRGVLSAADAVRDAVSAEDVSMSHSSIRVRVGSEPRWFVKRADRVRSHGRDLGSEAEVYRLAASNPVLAQVVPRCWLIDDRDEIVVLDAVAGASLATMFLSGSERAPTAPAILRAYGEAVGHVHRVRPRPFGQPPWLLVSLEPRWGRYDWLPPDCAALLRRLAALPTFRAGFAQARHEWRRVCLVHGDIRWANAIADALADTVKVSLVDWELACVGDPAWDVGSLIADLVAGETWQPSREGELLSNTLSVLAGYRDAAEVEPRHWPALLRRSVRLAGVRIVQTLIEHAHVTNAGLRDVEASLLPWSQRFLTEAPAIAAEFDRDLRVEARA